MTTDDHVLEKVTAKIVINPYIDEPLISDQLIDKPGIVVISFSKGLWRHRSDHENIVRESAR